MGSGEQALVELTEFERLASSSNVLDMISFARLVEKLVGNVDILRTFGILAALYGRRVHSTWVNNNFSWTFSRAIDYTWVCKHPQHNMPSLLPINAWDAFLFRHIVATLVRKWDGNKFCCTNALTLNILLGDDRSSTTINNYRTIMDYHGPEDLISQYCEQHMRLPWC